MWESGESPTTTDRRFSGTIRRYYPPYLPTDKRRVSLFLGALGQGLLSGSVRLCITIIQDTYSLYEFELRAASPSELLQIVKFYLAVVNKVTHFGDRSRL